MTLWDDKKLQRVCRNRQTRQQRRQPKPLGNLLENFLQRSVLPRQKNMSQLDRAWRELLPPELAQHSCLASLRGGKLRVLVDEAASMFELQLLVQQGLLDQLRQECPRVAVSQIRIARGQW
jgi:hypothetical protein